MSWSMSTSDMSKLTLRLWYTGHTIITVTSLNRHGFDWLNTNRPKYIREIETAIPFRSINYRSNYVSGKLLNSWLDNSNLPFELDDVDGAILLVGELLVVSSILDADDTRAEDAAFVAELFPACKRFDNAPLDVMGLRVPVVYN